MEGDGGIELGAHARIRTGDLFLTKNALCPSTRLQAVLISLGPFPYTILVDNTRSPRRANFSSICCEVGLNVRRLCNALREPNFSPRICGDVWHLTLSF